MEDNKIAPVVINAGTQSKKRIRKLKDGEGRLVEDVNNAISDVHPTLVAGNSTIIPVVILVRKKAAKARGGGRRRGLLGMMGM